LRLLQYWNYLQARPFYACVGAFSAWSDDTS
jgi:hypothetical protein